VQQPVRVKSERVGIYLQAETKKAIRGLQRKLRQPGQKYPSTSNIISLAIGEMWERLK